MIHRPAKIKRINTNENPADVKAKTATAGAATSSSTNVLIAAKGALATSASGTLQTAIDDKATKHNADMAATGVMHTKNELAVKAYNALATTVELEDPNNPDGWIAEGFQITETDITALPLPAQVVNGSVSNGDFLGTADVHHDPAANADNYTHRVTKGDPTDDSKYIAVTSPEPQYTKSSATVIVPADYVNMPLFWKTTAHNSKGAGPESTPYGGGRINS